MHGLSLVAPSWARPGCRLADGSLLEIAKVYPMDAVYDTPEDVPEEVRGATVQGMSGGMGLELPLAQGPWCFLAVAVSTSCPWNAVLGGHLWETTRARRRKSLCSPCGLMQVRTNKRYAGASGWTVQASAAGLVNATLVAFLQAPP